MAAFLDPEQATAECQGQNEPSDDLEGEVSGGDESPEQFLISSPNRPFRQKTCRWPR
jgi:hypothetical protein